MKCLLCNSFSFSHVCWKCQKLYFTPSLYIRDLDGFKVYSFYRYDEVEEFIKSKKSYIGYYLLDILTRNSMVKFLQGLEFGENIYLVPVDDRVSQQGYSHTAIIAKRAENGNRNLKSLFQTLIATNRVSYFGKDAKFRRENKRKFRVSPKLSHKKTILIDDVITTGSTLLEAYESVKNSGSIPLFGMTLATTANK